MNDTAMFFSGLFKFSLFVCLVPLSAWAADSEVSTKIPAQEESALANLDRANIAVGGSLGVGYSSFSGFVADLNPKIEYFIADGLSVGGALRASFDKYSSIYGIGPSITYYPIRKDRFTGYLGAGALYNTVSDRSNVRAPNYWIGQARLGMLYFFTPAVAFGPELSFTHDFLDSSKGTNNLDRTQLLFQFSLFL